MKNPRWRHVAFGALLAFSAACQVDAKGEDCGRGEVPNYEKGGCVTPAAASAPPAMTAAPPECLAGQFHCSTRTIQQSARQLVSACLTTGTWSPGGFLCDEGQPCDEVRGVCGCEPSQPTGCAGDARLVCSADGKSTVEEPCAAPTPACRLGRCVPSTRGQ